MIMRPVLRKLALTAHITCSVGWLGAVATFLAIAIAGLTSTDSPLVQAAYLAMELMTWYVIVPLALASLLTGIVSSLGTRWGLFRYYWVVVKLVITILSTIILLVHTQPISHLAQAASTVGFKAQLDELRLQMVVASGAAVIVLLALTAISVYQPRGMTAYGQGKVYEQYKVQ
jgi:hypothetical protein